MLDEHGIATVSLTLQPDLTRLARPSLACLVELPFGLTLGAVGDHERHRRIVLATLEAAYEDHPAGTIVDLNERFEDDDERERQLRLDA